MDASRLKSYLDGWSSMCSGGETSIVAMLSNADPEITFSDVNAPEPHSGHRGIREICAIAAEKYPGAAIAWRDLLFDGRNWSIRWTMAGRRPDGTDYGWKGASAGRVGEDGKVIEQTDYWSAAAAVCP